MEPLVDIIVPTYNRKHDLKKFIAEIEKQSYSNYIVHIVDDFGSEDLAKIIPSKPQFNFTRLPENRGQAFARNYAAAKSTGDFIVFMDDDAWFTSSYDLQTVVDIMSGDSGVGCLMFDLLEPNRALLSERKKLKEGQILGDFIACACAFRKAAFLATDGFNPIFHSYGEETEIGIQLLQADYKIQFTQKVRVFHNYNPGVRSLSWKKRFIKNSVKNDLLVINLRFPPLVRPIYSFAKILSHIIHNIKVKNNPGYVLPGINAFLKDLQTIKNDSKPTPMNLRQFNYWRKIRM